jgi:hypothetical protein
MTDETEAYVAITRLVRAYADIGVRRAWAEVPSLAAPDARFSFHTKTGVVEFAGEAFAEQGPRLSAMFSFAAAYPVNFVIAVGADGTARGRSYLFEVAEDAQTGEWIEIYGVYHDTYVLQAGRWLFSARDYRPLGRRTAGRLESFPMGDRPLPL